jgi:hypothetical protein
VKTKAVQNVYRADFYVVKISWSAVCHLCLAVRCLGNSAVCTQRVCRGTRVDSVCSRKVDEWGGGGQALRAGEVISNGLIDWSLRVRRELSDVATSAEHTQADNVILHIHPVAAQAVTPTHPQST